MLNKAKYGVKAALLQLIGLIDSIGLIVKQDKVLYHC